MKIHQLSSYDDDVLGQLDQLFTQVSSGNGELAQSLRNIFDSSHSALFVVRDAADTKIIGAVIVNLYQKARYLEARLDDVVVDQHYRGQGLSKQLVSSAIAWACSQGAGSVELTSHNGRLAANHLYRSLGFELRETNVYKLTL